MINKLLFSKDTDTWHTIFNESRPFRHLIIDDFLQPAFAHSLLESFPSIEKMKTHYAGLNERKAEDNDFVKHDQQFTLLHKTLGSPEFTTWLTASITISIRSVNCNENSTSSSSSTGTGRRMAQKKPFFPRFRTIPQIAATVFLRKNRRSNKR